MKKILLCIGLLIAGNNLFAQSAQPFEATGTEIRQGDKVIANYTRKEARMPNDKVEMVMTFTNTDGSIIATATIPYQQKGFKTVIKTARDNKEQKIVLESNTDIEMAKEIATQLSSTKYL